MSIATSIMVFLVIWWLIFFMMLPTGVVAQNESEDGTTLGSTASAPVNPQIKRKIIVTTGVTFVLWGIFMALALSGAVSFRDYYERTEAEDRVDP